MKLLPYLILYFSTISTAVYGQTKKIEINGNTFSFIQTDLDTAESAQKTIVELYRNEKKLLTHTVFEEEGDCSSIHIELGNYKVGGNKIKFYSYWAATDRMPGAILPFGFREQIYSVDSLGILKLTEATIYIENYIASENKNFLEEDGWTPEGLKYLNQPVQTEYHKKLLEEYIKNVEKEYNAQFVLNEEKDVLEKKVRSVLKDEIKKYTKNWIEGNEGFGRVKK